MAAKSINAPSFAALPPSERRRVAGRIVSALRRAGWMGRGKYDVVTRDIPLRERISAESGGETSALTADERNRLIALVRNLRRNSEHLNALLTQMDLNVVGCTGGKAYFDFPDAYREAAERLHSAFGNWARECEFFDGLPLQDLLKIALRTKFVTGRAVLLFDDGIICDSGRVVLFEGDAIANIPQAEFARRFPAGWSQHQGLIKDAFGRTRGAFCSMSQRGCTEFSRLADDRGRLAVWALVRGDGETALDSQFAIYQHVMRINQVASVPCVAPSVGSIMDLEALTKYEMQTAKKASQTIATVTQPEPQTPLSAGLDPDAYAPVSDDATDAELDAEAAAAADEGGNLELPEVEGAGTIYDVLPPGLKMEMLSPAHPNTNVIGMVTWIKQNAAWANGMAGLFATGKADSSYSASLVEQAVTWPKFEAEQQSLKTGVLDWLLVRWHAWAVRKGIIPDLKLPPDWIRAVDYSFPRRREADAQKQNAALQSGIKNFLTGYQEQFGPSWRRRMEQYAKEVDFARKLGIPHPAIVTVSGQTINPDLTTEDKPASVEKQESDE